MSARFWDGLCRLSGDLMSEDVRDSTVPPLPRRSEPSLASTQGERKIEAARRAVAGVEAVRERGVLVVEDDPDLQWRLARMLTVRGNRVVGTSSGEAALELMSQWPVDLVLVDDTLPGMSGVELARVIQERHGGIPVVLMSADDTRESRLAARLAGAVAVLTKPFAIESLFDLLRSLPGYGADLVPAE
jgi:CheY-like chemotaxis protein